MGQRREEGMGENVGEGSSFKSLGFLKISAIRKKKIHSNITQTLSASMLLNPILWKTFEDKMWKLKR